MSHYLHNLRDVEFNLFEVFGRGEVLGHGPYAEFDDDAAREILREVARLRDGRPRAGARRRRPQPAGLRPGDVQRSRSRVLQEGLQAAFVDAGFWGIGVRPEVGGTAAPSSVYWAMSEFILGSNAPVHMYASAFAFADVLYTYGTPEQQQLAKLMVEREWGSTMVLTEPDAGSDVGAGRAKAVQQPDGTWHITGVKRFITSAEHDMADNIVHFVLARPRAPARHQGPVAVHRAQVPRRRPRDRRARRAQRRVRDERRGQDGHQGVHHVRGPLRRGRRHPRRSARCSATSTTASRRCSRSSRARG
jgi:alkylation response protein AidB-like acyl-CoA dehydrogenase